MKSESRRDFSISPAFQRRERVATVQSPEGTAELGMSSAVPSGLVLVHAQPGVETPGYCQMSLRDNPALEPFRLRIELRTEQKGAIAR